MHACRSTLEDPTVRYSIGPDDDGERFVRRIGLVAGSGMSLYPAAVERGVDLFLTGDAKYHDFHAANDSVPIVDAGHAETERYVVECMVDLITTLLVSLESDVDVIALAASNGPIGYAV